MAAGQWLIIVVFLVVKSASECETRDSDHAHNKVPVHCQDIKLPDVQQFQEIKNDVNDVIGYRIVLLQNDVTVVPTWHRFHEIPEVRSHEFNYPLPPNDPEFLINNHYRLNNVLETSVQMTSQYDGTQYGLQLDMTSECGPLSVYVRPHMEEFKNVTEFPIIRRKIPSVATIPNICENKTIDMIQTVEFNDPTIEGTAGLTRILKKKIGVNDMVDTYDALEFNPDSNAYYELETVKTDNGSIATQSWRIEDIRQENYIGLYQFYVSMDSQDQYYKENKKDPMVYMITTPFVIKPDHFEAISVGVLPCYPFRRSSERSEIPVKNLGFVKGYRPCFRVLTQTTEPIKQILSPYHVDERNPLPTYSGPDIGGMREHWYVLEDGRVPHRINDYQLTISTQDFTFIIPFTLTRYTPAQPIIAVQEITGGKVLTCTSHGYPQPKTHFYQMNRYYTLGGDSHWDIQRLIEKFHPLKSEIVSEEQNVDSETWTKKITLDVSYGEEERLVKYTTNKAMPLGIACVTWNEFSHNIAFWSPVKIEIADTNETESLNEEKIEEVQNKEEKVDSNIKVGEE